MNRFTYARAADLPGAVRELATPRAKVIAGGTNLIDLMKYNVEAPSRLVDITRLPGLGDIDQVDGGLRIGALVSNTALATHPEVVARYPLLSHTILHGATTQLRNAASTGGNLLQRTRCYYFYDPATPCNKREPGTGCPAKEGLSRIHAILGASEQCIATHPSDMCVALAALAATVQVTGPGGDRTIAFADFHRLPGDTPWQDTNLAADEIVTSVTLPAESAAFAGHHTYLKLRDRHSYAFALVSVAAGLRMEGGTVAGGRVALGGVAHKPWRDTSAEDLLCGQAPGAELFGRVADHILRDAKGYPNNSFKIGLARRAIVRALQQAAAGTPQRPSDKSYN